MARSPFPTLPRWLALTLVGCATGLLLLLPPLVRLLGLATDFLSFYTAGQVVLHDESGRLYDLPLYEAWQQGWLGDGFEATFRFVYLPLFATFYLPLAALPLLAARLLWLGLSGGALGLAVRLSRRWSGLSVGEGGIILLAFPATYATLLVGQNTPATLLIFASVAALMWRGQASWLAGVLAGLALYKPQLLVGLLLLWLWQRRWQPLLAFAGSTALILLGSLLVSAPATWHYLTLGPWLLASADGHRANAALLVEVQHRLPALLVPWVVGALVVGVLASLLFAWARAHPSSRYLHAMLWLTPLLITPYIAQYDLLLLLLPLSFLTVPLRTDRALRILVALLWPATVANLAIGAVVLPAAWLTVALYALCFWRTLEGVARDPWPVARGV